MSEADIVPVKPEIEAKALVNRARYEDMYQRAAASPDEFWAEECKRIAWIKQPTKIKNTSFTGDVSIKWFEDGTLNAVRQLSGPASGRAWRPGGDHLGG